MGIGKFAFDIYSELYKKGFFKNINSVIELGSQSVIAPDKKEILDFLKSINKSSDLLEKAYLELGGRRMKEVMTGFCVLAGKSIYEWLGIKNYESIDIDGKHGAHKFRLDYDLNKVYNFNRKFDLVTNHGTTEHILNQYMCFKNMHDLTRVGGYMFHGVPGVNHINHGFFSYNQIFFKDLASANNYKIVEMWIGIMDKEFKIYNVTDKINNVRFDYIDEIIMKHLQKKEINNIALFYLLRKTKPDEFKVPIQEIYSGKSIKIALRKKLNVKVPKWIGEFLSNNLDMHNLFFKTEKFLK